MGKAYRGAFNDTEAPVLSSHVVNAAIARAGIDPALRLQFEPLEEALAALGVAVWPMVDLEADDALGAAALNGAASILFATVGVARLAGPAGLAVLFYAREIWAATPEGERRDPRLIFEILALTLATGVALIWIGVGR